MPALVALLLAVATAAPPPTPQAARPASPPASAAAPAPAAPPWLDGLDREIEGMRRAWEVPGVSVAIVQNDRIVYARGFGVRALGRPEPVDADTLFAIGSNTKAFTAAAVVLAAEEGRLSLDDRVVDRLPGFQLRDPWVTREARIRDCLSHRLGYERWAGDLVAWGSSYDRREIVRRIRFLEPAPGAFRTFGYNNWPFTVAALVLEGVDGRPWEATVRERLLRPMGMTRTTTSVPDLARDRNVATPHSLLEGAWRPIRHTRVDGYGPAAGMYSSAREMAAWLRTQLADGLLDGRRVLPAAVLEAMRTPQVVRPMDATAHRRQPTTHLRALGLGLMLRDHRGRLVVEHGGAVDGFFSQVTTVPEERLGIVVLTNSETWLMEALTATILDRALAVPQAERRDWSGDLLAEWRADAVEGLDVERSMLPPRRTDARPPLPLDRYVGRYTSDLLGDAVVAVRDGALTIEMPWHPGLSSRLEPWSGDVFAARWKDPAFKVSPIAFVVGADGRAAELRLRVLPFIDPLEHAFRRAPDPAPRLAAPAP